MSAADGHQRSAQPASACAVVTQRAAAPASQGRALVAIATAAQVETKVETTSAASRPSAVFLAHLIAVDQQAPQTRQRRRAELDEANAVYAEACAPPGRAGRAFCRSL
jgi:hypothetical protein